MYIMYCSVENEELDNVLYITSSIEKYVHVFIMEHR